MKISLFKVIFLNGLYCTMVDHHQTISNHHLVEYIFPFQNFLSKSKSFFQSFVLQLLSAQFDGRC